LKNNSSQIFSLDLLIAGIAFIVILVSANLFWDYANSEVDLVERRNDMELAAINVMSVFIETEGDPKNWSALDDKDFNRSNIFYLGLAKNKSLATHFSGPWQFDSSKLNYLNSSNYNRTKKMLGLAGYEFNLTVRVYDGSALNFNHSVSGDFSDVETILKTTRLGLLDGKKAELVLRVGRNG
jgi:hypothetical protein